MPAIQTTANTPRQVIHRCFIHLLLGSLTETTTDTQRIIMPWSRAVHRIELLYSSTACCVVIFPFPNDSQRFLFHTHLMTRYSLPLIHVAKFCTRCTVVVVGGGWRQEMQRNKNRIGSHVLSLHLYIAIPLAILYVCTGLWRWRGSLPGQAIHRNLLS